MASSKKISAFSYFCSSFPKCRFLCLAKYQGQLMTNRVMILQVFLSEWYKNKGKGLREKNQIFRVAAIVQSQPHYFNFVFLFFFLLILSYAKGSSLRITQIHIQGDPNKTNPKNKNCYFYYIVLKLPF